MSLFNTVSFDQIALAIMATAALHEAALLLPRSVVGPNGWLLRTEDEA